MSAPLELRNPHSVLAALLARPKDVQRVSLSKSPSDAWERVADLAKKSGCKVDVVQGRPGGGGGGHDKDRDRSGSVALVRPRESALLSDVVASDDDQGLWLALDSVQDPHNVGAIFRTAAFFGVRGIILMQDRAAALTAAVYDTACGGLESVPFAIEVNLARALQEAKDAGLWVLGTSEHASESLFKVARDRKWLAVLGNEERGMRRLIQESCDVLCTIPNHSAHENGGPAVTSLNVSVVGGIVISHLTAANH